MATLTQPAQIEETATENDNALTEKVYGELIELLARGGGPEAIIAFRSPEEAQDRAYELIYRKRERNGLTAHEAKELDSYVQREHIVRMAKIRARVLIKQKIDSLSNES